MKKKIIVIIILVLILLLGIWFGYKVYILNKYNIDNIDSKAYISFIEALKNKSTITISESLETSAKMQIDNLTIRNDFSNFVLDNNFSSDGQKYNLYDEDNNVVAWMWLGNTGEYTNYSFFVSELKVLGNNIDKDKIYLIDAKTRADYLNKHNILSELEIFDFLLDSLNNRPTLFTSAKEIKTIYSLHQAVFFIYPEINSLTLIDGNLNGYIINLENERIVKLFNNEEEYYITFHGLDYFTDDYISELLKTITIK